MKFIRILVFSLFLMPLASFGASSDFMLAAQLLAAAKSADIIQVQALVNNGANVNFVDSTESDVTIPIFTPKLRKSLIKPIASSIGFVYSLIFL